ncbi:CPBP family intramembrane glutamic endopeptidase [Schleiferilactobacillus harbinensis]|jgi:membrane protease YdiL (CAAX protease family)|uniref:CPBP family intramembrane glutamic endopeptidase n=1 Tax=Schleiferilactobacillus harbinensis TaxID=304207 RepID=UPI0024302DA1|nr:type II CAAX endopeptidase family protein [Schleiferilactobacillus harbinensis]MCI1849459.1 CPBP family intramembrane metalloprotease [Schleiferilactobacillus harbinensis]
MASYQVPIENKLPMPHQEPPRKRIKSPKDIAERLLFLIIAIVLIYVPQVPMSVVLVLKKRGTPASMPLYIAMFALMIALYIGAVWLMRFLIHRYTDQPLVRRWEKRDALYVVLGYLAMFGAKLILLPFYTSISGEQLTKNDAVIRGMLKDGNQIIFMIVFMTVIAAPILEEMVFRGYVMTAFYTRNPIWPILISGVLFGLVHQNNNIAGTLIYVALGAILAYVYRRTGNITVNIGLHFLNNAPMIFMALQFIK